MAEIIDIPSLQVKFESMPINSMAFELKKQLPAEKETVMWNYDGEVVKGFWKDFDEDGYKVYVPEHDDWYPLDYFSCWYKSR